MNFSGGRSPHCDRSASSAGNEMRTIGEIEAIAVGPMLVHAAPRIGPVIVDLAAKHVAADAPHVLVGAERFEEVVAHAHVVDVGHLE